MAECNGYGAEVQEVRTYRNRMDAAGEYRKALLTMSYVEWLLCCLLVAMVVVGGALYFIIKAIVWLKDHDWEI